MYPSPEISQLTLLTYHSSSLKWLSVAPTRKISIGEFVGKFIQIRGWWWQFPDAKMIKRGETGNSVLGMGSAALGIKPSIARGKQ